MSPLGRVFIVLNLALAGGFAVFAGTHLQKQDNFKKKWEAAEQSKKDEVTRLSAQIEQIDGERRIFENAKTANETQLGEANKQIGRLLDENKRLEEVTSKNAALIAQLVSTAEAGNTEAKAAFERAQEAYAMAIKDQQAKDEAVRAKDAAEAENRTLKNQIAQLDETVEGKNAMIASLEKDNSEQKLLVSAATVNGFLPAMAAPTLAGTVTNASGRLVTISISDNPGDVDIQDQINRRPFRFAISDASGYKAEAVATKYEPTANAVLCNVLLTAGSRPIRAGDSATTNTP